MRRIFTLMLGHMALAVPMLAQDVDETFVFLDEQNEFEVIADGATITRNALEVSGDGVEIIKAGIYVLDNGSAPNDVLVMHYTVDRIDNGAFQICFPSSCNSQDAVGEYVTAAGTVLDGFQDIQSEWLPTADGKCVVTLSIEIQTKTAGFPPKYEHKADGPTLTLEFVKGDEPTPGPVKGDVNGDGEVNISDVNSVINAVLSGAGNADVNEDGEVNLSDVNYVIDIILNQ